MKRNFSSLCTNKKLLMAIASALIVVLCAGVVYAAAVVISSFAKIQVSTITLDAESEFSYANGATELKFTKPGDKKQIQVRTTNRTPSVLQCSYSFSLSEEDKEKTLASAVFVYLGDEYLGTLSALTAGSAPSIAVGSYVGAGSSEPSSSVTDTLTFELHLGASNSVFKDQALSLTVTAYTATADYAENIFVSTPADLSRALDDVNSGLLDSPTIVLLQDVNGNGEIGNACNVDLNGHTLSGNFTLNGENALWNVTGKGANEADYTLTQYDKQAALELLVSSAKEVLRDGVTEGTHTLYGKNEFYLSENDRKLTLGKVDRPTVNTLTVTLGENGEYRTIKYTQYGEGDITNYLKNIPDDENEIVTSDLYLPLSIKAAGATIEWTSNAPEIMDNTGRITAAHADRVPVTLYAAVSQNGKTEIKEFSFKVSVRTNEINFYQLVAKLSPVILYEVANTTLETPTGYYQLPLVATGNDYDYRQTYTTPEKSSLAGDNADELNYTWKEYRDIFLSELSYSLVKNREGAEIYDYIGLNGAQVYLKNDTLNTYAEVEITGRFAAGDEYTSRVKLIIAVGTDTTILEAAFNHANTALAQVNVLKNILESRKTDGMAKESGDFTLPVKYETADSGTYTFSYAQLSNDGVVKEIVNGKVMLDPTKFDDTESIVGIKVTVKWGSIENSRNYYFTIPAVVHTAELGNASLFNSVKYQIFQQLPEDERNTDTDGFALSADGKLTNTMPDYILLRDIVGDKEYKASYYSLDKSGYPVPENNFHEGCSELWFYTAVADGSSDDAVRNMSRLIAWATGIEIKSVSEVVSGLDSSVKSDGNQYMTENEIAVLKAYYQSVTKETDAEWEMLWTEVSEKAPGYVIWNPTHLYDEVKKLVATSSGNGIDVEGYFKYIETLRWATNQTRNKTDSSGVLADAINNLGVVGNRDWLILSKKNFPDFDSTKDHSLRFSENIDGNTRDVSYTYQFTDAESNTVWFSSEKRAYNDSSIKSKYNVKNYILKVDNMTLDGREVDRQAVLNSLKEVYGSSSIADSTMTTSYLADLTDYIAPTEFEAMAAYWLNSNLENGKNFVNAFYESALIPTYFTDDGVEKLLSALYEKCGISIGTDNGFISSVKETTANNAGLDTSGKKVKTAPTVANLEQLSSAAYYFTQLQNLYVFGNESLPAFLSDYGLTSALSRFARSLPDLETLVLEHAADNYVNFDLSALKEIKGLKQIDVSDNRGVTNVSPLVNVNSGKYTYVDFSNVNEEVTEEFSQYTLKNLPSASKVYYTKDGNRTLYSGNTAADKSLTYLDDLDRIIAENKFLPSSVSGSDSSDDAKIYWRIEDGNQITLVSSAGNAVTMTVEELNLYISPYYFEAGKIYKYTFSADISKVLVLSDVIQIENVGEAATDYTGVAEKTGTTVAKATEESFAQEGVERNNSYTMNYYRLYNSSYYMYDNGGTLAVGSSTAINPSDNSYIYLLNEDEFTSVSQGKETAISSKTTSDEYYLYFLSTGRFFPVLQTGNSVTLTNDSKQAGKYKIASSGTGVSLQNGGYYISIQGNNRNYSINITTNRSSVSYTSGAKTQYYTLKVTTSNGETSYSKVTSFGYDIWKRVTYTDVEKHTETKYYFDGKSAYEVVYEWNKYKQTTEYYVRFWYSVGSGTGTTVNYLEDATEIGNGEVSYKKEMLEQAETFPKGGTVPVDWQKQDPKITTYYSHVNGGEETVVQARIKAATNGYYVQTPGGSETVIVFGSSAKKSYNNGIYSLSLEGRALQWKEYTAASVTGSGNGVMDDVLSAANENFSNQQYGKYYGTYYAYNGPTITTQRGFTYLQQGVYRLMPNAENNAFEFVYVKQYEETTIDEITETIAKNSEESNQALVGSIYYLKESGRTYAVGLYEVAYDSTSGSYYLKSFCNLELEYDTTGNISFLHNMRILSECRSNTSDYGGTGSTLEVTVTAFVRVGETEYKRQYRVRVVG